MRSLSLKVNLVVSKNHKHQKSTHNESVGEKNNSQEEKEDPSPIDPSRQGEQDLSASPPSVMAKIFVGGIPSTSTTEDLIKYFQAFGEVLGIELKTKRKNVNVNLGYGTITVQKSTADKILDSNFHYINGRKIECQRFVLSNKSRSKLINDKKIKTLYISEPPESMNDNNLRAFFEKFGEIENCYILPERRVPLPPEPKSADGEDEKEEGSLGVTKFDVLRKKALILFRTSEGAREAYEKSRQGEVVFDGVVIKLDYKWPKKADKILNKRREQEKATKLQKEEGEEDLVAQENDLKDSGSEEEETVNLGPKVVNQERGSKRIKEKHKKSSKNNKISQNLTIKTPSKMRSADQHQLERGYLPIPLLEKKEFGKRGEMRSRIVHQKSEPIQKNLRNHQKNHKNQEKNHSQKTRRNSELTQKQLLTNLPKSLQRSKNMTRPGYYPGFWGNLFQRLEENRRHYKPGQREYKHKGYQPEPIHTGKNIRINMQNTHFRGSIFSYRNAPITHIHSGLYNLRGQFYRSSAPALTEGTTFGQFSL